MDKALATLEFQLLSAAAHLGARAYGAAIYSTVREQTGRAVSLGACYATLGRLEAKGYLTSTEGEPTPERGGRRKRFYRITGAGVVVLRDSVAMLQRSLALVPSFG